MNPPSKQEAIAEMIWKESTFHTSWEDAKKLYPLMSKFYLELAQKILNYLEGKHEH